MPCQIVEPNQVHLVEQWVAAGPGERGVELAVDLAELLEVAGDGCSKCCDLISLGLGGPLRSELHDRGLDHLANLEQLSDECLAVVAGEVGPFGT